MDILEISYRWEQVDFLMSFVYRIDFPDGKVYFGYTAKPLAVRLEEHIESSRMLVQLIQGKNV